MATGKHRKIAHSFRIVQFLPRLRGRLLGPPFQSRLDADTHTAAFPRHDGVLRIGLGSTIQLTPENLLYDAGIPLRCQIFAVAVAEFD